MAIVKKGGHAVTTVLPANSDAASVTPLNVLFPGVESRTKVNPNTATITKGSK